MIQNLKADIIYYKTNTDFEMEFNLCGCCRMRLLTDKAADKKTLVHNLARSVSRSRVIIIAGELLGEEGIIQITAKAIAKTVTKIDKSLYGINSDEEIGIINGATPLVTSDGEFGGCIIESGPQSMILLSSDRAIRKEIMHTLIHPYIEELCTLEFKAKVKKNEGEEEKAIATLKTESYVAPLKTDVENEFADNQDIETENTTEEAAESYIEADSEEEKEEIDEPVEKAEPDRLDDEPLSSFSSKTDAGVALEGGMVFESDDYRSEAETFGEDEDSELFIEPGITKKNHKRNYSNSYFSQEDAASPYHTPDDFDEKPKNRFSGNLPILIISVLLLIIAAVLCYSVFYVPAKDGITATAYLSETFSTLFG